MLNIGSFTIPDLNPSAPFLLPIDLQLANHQKTVEGAIFHMDWAIFKANKKIINRTIGTCFGYLGSSDLLSFG